MILDHMVNPEIGCGYNQFDIAFHRKPAINIRRTWNAERETGEVIDSPKDTTSYGHNMELAWLLHRAAEVMGDTSGGYDTICQKLVDHGLKYGFDWERGGVYRDGPHEGEPLVRDKEWWQNCESLVGLLDIYEMTGEEEYFQAFRKNWEFDTTYMICHSVGEWHQLLTEKGEVLVPQMGNPWKAMYHTGRAMLECLLRLEKLAGKRRIMKKWRQR